MTRSPETIMQDYIDAGYVNSHSQTISCGAWGNDMAAEIRRREGYYRTYFLEHGLVGMVRSVVGPFAIMDAQFLFFRREEDDYYVAGTGIDDALVYIPIRGSEI